MSNKPKENAVDTLQWQIHTVLKCLFQMEYRFHATRKWRADMCLPGVLIIEIDGGVWTGGRHTRGSGFIGDMEKLNEAAILGYRVLRFTPAQVRSGEALNVVERFFKEKP